VWGESLRRDGEKCNDCRLDLEPCVGRLIPADEFARAAWIPWDGEGADPRLLSLEHEARRQMAQEALYEAQRAARAERPPPSPEEIKKQEDAEQGIYGADEIFGRDPSKLH
jgi:hypothetical protein